MNKLNEQSVTENSMVENSAHKSTAEQSTADDNVVAQPVPKPSASAKKVDVLAEKKKRALKETANFKKKYFDYYDDIKISAREDW